MTSNHPLIVNVDATEFDPALVADDRLVLVDFTASWCQPCKVLQPHLERLAENEAERLRVIAVDVDAVHEPMERYGVQSMPTLLLFDGATLLARLTGESPERLVEVTRVLDARDGAPFSVRSQPGKPASRPARTLRLPDRPRAAAARSRAAAHPARSGAGGRGGCRVDRRHRGRR